MAHSPAFPLRPLAEPQLELLRAVAQLPFRIILTTAQDNLLQRVFADGGKRCPAGCRKKL